MIMKTLFSNPILVIDVESIGLHGQAYAIAMALFLDRKEIEHHVFAMHPDLAHGSDEDREWVKQNIPDIEANCCDFAELRYNFVETWATISQVYPNVMMVAECAWPVETNFLSACKEHELAFGVNRKFASPYPLFDISSFMFMAGMNPLAIYDRLPTELPKHDPLCDVRQSARLMYAAFDHINLTDWYYTWNGGQKVIPNET